MAATMSNIGWSVIFSVVGGLVGMGQTTLLNAIFGSIAINNGHIEYKGKKINVIYRPDDVFDYI